MSGAVVTFPGASDWRRPAMAGFTVIFLAFGMLGGWAALTQIDGAVVAQGTVAIESNSKPVQHLEGGIIASVLVKEGDRVEEGQVVVRLSDVQAKATLDTYLNQLITVRVFEARLLAERDELPNIVLPPSILEASADPVVRKAIADQELQFEDRRRALQGQVSILESRIRGLQTEIDGLVIEEQSLTKQVGYINEELVGLRQLLANKLVPLARVLAMERERTRLEGAIGRAVADQAHSRNSIGEARMQIQELKHKFQEETAASITDVGQKISDLNEKRRVAQDVLSRIEVKAPTSGTIQDLKAYGPGQVVRPGEALMQVVPASEELIIRAHFAISDISPVHAGQRAEVRFPAFHSRAIPIIMGHMASVSRDRLIDEATHQPYFLGVVSVAKTDVPEDLKARLRAGMPAEVIVSSGSRTVLSYLISPLTEAWRKSLREQ
jgi:HlyD family secretion protein